MSQVCNHYREMLEAGAAYRAESQARYEARGLDRLLAAIDSPESDLVSYTWNEQEQRLTLSRPDRFEQV